MQHEGSAQVEGCAISFAFDDSDLNAFRHAFEVIIKLAADGLAGADAGYLIDLPGMERSRQEGVAAWVDGVADGNGAGMATAVSVIDTLACHALRNNRHFKGNLFHGIGSFQVIKHVTGLAWWNTFAEMAENRSTPYQLMNTSGSCQFRDSQFRLQGIMFLARKGRYRCLPDYGVRRWESLLSVFV